MSTYLPAPFKDQGEVLEAIREIAESWLDGAYGDETEAFDEIERAVLKWRRQEDKRVFALSFPR